ncbi:hypothetical protein PFICI_15299 [Pestalotiopsis fici W106-1]|uniref:Protein kinase domain-containing protein n=1 Tax=Pestalotiopsis fici (strain W106-1 / CGMCC3.15140) TaxID=1229662 RepID=W3WID6_PESFW|nr:uncharacterized protein PFICI_15299 [Pestalotiopsis fici W106-1]ETS72907.1 hypothetical protein PFICI_15299 [Pestalotiopsis fici W106-1]
MSTRANQTLQELESYFQRDSRFKVEKFIGAGNHAGTYRVSYTEPGTQKKQNFIVKRAFDGEDDALQLAKERHYLNELRSNIHIVDMVNFPNNPLRTSPQKAGGTMEPPGAPTKNPPRTPTRHPPKTPTRDPLRTPINHPIRKPTKHPPRTPTLNPPGFNNDDGDDGIWNHVICLEWLDNGTLRSFILKAKRRSEPLPNRLLWRFLGCLLRAAIGLAWPVTPELGGTPQPETPRSSSSPRKPARKPTLLTHNDLHDGNIMLGEELPDIEHGITPILKWIDFGLAGEFAGDGRDPLYGVKGNLYDVGQIMCGIILRKLWDGKTLEEPVQVKELGGAIIFTDAPIWPTFGQTDVVADNFDNDLRRVVSWIMATNKNDRPSIDNAFEAVMEEIELRDAKYYKGRAEEEDYNIRKLWRQLVLEPDIMPSNDVIMLSS